MTSQHDSSRAAPTRASQAGHPAPTWSLRRVQLLGALFLAVAVPGAVTLFFAPELYGSSLWVTSLVGASLAIVVASYFLTNLIAFPGTRSDFHILPVYTASYAVLLAVLLFARLEYSRPLLLASYAIAMGWQFLVSYKLQVRQRLAVAVVPFGRVDSLYSIKVARWRILEDPKMPRDCRAIVADFDSDLSAAWEHFLANQALRGVSVFHYKRLRESLTGQVEIEHLSENANGTLEPNRSFLFAKLMVDIVAAIFALIALGPLMLLVALLIRIDSPGPALFSQQRIGYRGQTFRIWKFRTMRSDTVELPAESTSTDYGLEAAKTVDADPRITRLGRFLRQSRLDELPQMFNILRGQMSWIGPRPEVVVLSSWYQKEIPFYRYRHIVRPGITGWAQVNQGHVAELGDISHKLNFDFFYISNFSLWLDVLIIVRTVKTMLTGFGAR